MAIKNKQSILGSTSKALPKALRTQPLPAFTRSRIRTIMQPLLKPHNHFISNHFWGYFSLLPAACFKHKEKRPKKKFWFPKCSWLTMSYMALWDTEQNGGWVGDWMLQLHSCYDYYSGAKIGFQHFSSLPNYFQWRRTFFYSSGCANCKGWQMIQYK